MEVREYIAPNGKAPFSDWLGRLHDLTTRARVRARINRARLGDLGDTKPVGEGVFELRLQFGPGYQVYFGRVHSQLILLLCGGDKTTQARDISKAKKLWMEYRNIDHESA